MSLADVEVIGSTKNLEVMAIGAFLAVWSFMRIQPLTKGVKRCSAAQDISGTHCFREECDFKEHWG